LAPPLVIPTVPVQQIDTATVTRGPVRDVSRVAGLVSVDSVPVGFGGITGPFYRHYVNFGDAVTEGQLLARLDFTRLEGSITWLEDHIAYLQRLHAIQNSISSINIDILVQEGADSWVISRARLEHTLAQERQALTIEQNERALAGLREDFARSRLVAPMDGIVTQIGNFSYGSYVPPFSAIMYISPTDGEVFVDYIGDVHAVHVMLGAKRVVAHIGNQVYDLHRINLTRAQVSRLGPTALRFGFDTDITPPMGSYVNIHIYTQWVEDALRIPRAAVSYEAELGYYVLMPGTGGLTQIDITVGASTPTYIEVLSGLSEGDVVIVR